MTASGLVVKSATDVWAFGSMVSGDTYALRLNGRHWAKVAMPGIPDAVSSEGKGDDIYAVGPTMSTVGRAQRDVLMHRTGQAWSTVRLPHSGDENQGICPGISAG
jgi:hypothetical protein